MILYCPCLTFDTTKKGYKFKIDIEKSTSLTLVNALNNSNFGDCDLVVNFTHKNNANDKHVVKYNVKTLLRNGTADFLNGFFSGSVIEYSNRTEKTVLQSITSEYLVVASLGANKIKNNKIASINKNQLNSKASKFKNW